MGRGLCGNSRLYLSWYASSTLSAHPQSSPTPSAYTLVSLRCTLHKLTQPCHSCGWTKLGSMSNFPGLSPYVSELPPLVVKQGGLALPLCPSGWHGLKTVNAFTEAGVDRLLKAINKAYITKSGDGSMDLELSNQLLH